MRRQWMSAFILCLSVVSGLLLIPGRSAWASTDDASRLSLRLLNQSGLAEWLVHYPVMLKNGLRHNVERVGMPDGVARMFEIAVDGTYNVADVNEEVLVRIEADMSRQQMQDILTWYRSPVGRKVSQAEANVISDSEYSRLQQTLGDLTQQYAGTDREQLFAAFDRATRATESMLDNTLAVELAMAASLSALVKGSDLPDFSELKALLSERRKMLRGQVGQQVYMNYLYTYRDLSLQELRKYIAFARSENGNRYLEVVSNAVFEVLEEHSAKLGRRLNPDFVEG
ncbi:DUF2059 domain-containing protein [Hahella ganghwensis]|uniref:DUF2059 domain-containing protein n=1 Tax=Hahella ganghwensis TaxID=286420 RepID=UPI00035DA0FC|nr:DUF2059 domain-containing protein [Hahella ganghwensis]